MQTLEKRESLESRHAGEVERGERFAFGENWTRFLRVVDEQRIDAAVTSLASRLGTSSLSGMSVLDIGSGSGLFSLAAHRLGARVHSFDYDASSVACTRELRRRFASDDGSWTVDQGSVLDREYLASLGGFDVVYSWGVLHHTGDMWTACENAAAVVSPGGKLFIALYNDQGNWSHRWRRIKKLYCSGPTGRALVLGTIIPAFVLRGLAADLLWMRNPAARYIGYRANRGMSVVHDWVDWLGGYPFEFAKPELVFEFFEARGLRLRGLTTCGGSVGCNEFVFERSP